MKKSKYSSPYYAKDYFSKEILPSEVYAGQKIIRQPMTDSDRQPRENGWQKTHGNTVLFNDILRIRNILQA